MNGRIYDPQLGKMLQADPVQNPGSQGLNRYSYVANNPLTLTDPTGYSFWNWVKVAAAIAITVWTGGIAAGLLAEGSFWTGMAVAAAGGFAAGVITTGTLQGGLIGAFSAIAFYGIGSAFSIKNAPGLYENGEITAIGETGKVLAHGLAGGVGSVLSGGKFGNGFLSAGVAEAVSGRIAGIDAKNLGVSAERVLAAALVGGTTSALTGGKFANGAITSAFAQAYNDETHKPAPPVRVIFSGANEQGDNQELLDEFSGLDTKYYTTAAGQPIGGLVNTAANYVQSQIKSGASGVYIAGYSAGGDAAIELSAELGRRGIDVDGLVVFDPHSSIRPIGQEDYIVSDNVHSAIDVFQNNSRLWNKFSNPFDGGSIQCLSCTQINLTGLSVTHLNIVTYGVEHYADQIHSVWGR